MAINAKINKDYKRFINVCLFFHCCEMIGDVSGQTSGYMLNALIKHWGLEFMFLPENVETADGSC